MIKTTTNEFYFPQTQRDHEQIAFWIAEGYSSAQVFNLIKDPYWRSETDIYRGCLFCHSCTQMITSDYCMECGQALLGILPISFDFLPVPSRSRDYLKRTISEFLGFGVTPQEVLEFAHFRNTTRCQPPLDSVDVEMIFREVGAEELKRRGA